MENKNFLRTCNDLSMEMHRNDGRVCLRTLVDCKRKRFTMWLMYSNFLRAPTDLVPNAQHLRILHMFSSAASFAFLIQQDGVVVDEFRQHDGVVTVMVM